MPTTPLGFIEYVSKGDTSWYSGTDGLEQWLLRAELLGIPTYSTFADLPDPSNTSSHDPSATQPQRQFAAVVNDLTIYRVSNDQTSWEPWSNYYTDTDAVSAINNDADHGSTANHNYFSGSHADLTNVGASDHHTRFGASGAGDRLSDIPTRPHSDLTNVGANQHHNQNHDNADHTTNYLPEANYNPESDTHSRYTDQEARDSVDGSTQDYRFEGQLHPSYIEPDSQGAAPGTRISSIQERVVLFADSAIEYATILPNTDVYHNGSLHASHADPSTGSVTVAEGDRLSSLKPVAMAEHSDAIATPPLSHAGDTFTFNTNRYNPHTVKIYAPFAPVDVDYYFDTQPTGNTPNSTFTVPQDAVYTFTTPDGSDGQHRFICNGNVVMAKRAGTGDDAFQVRPAAREVLSTQGASAVTVDGGSVTNNHPHYTSGSLFSVTAIADGSGTNAEHGQPVSLCGDIYALAHTVDGYALAAVEPTIITVYSWDGTQWVEYATHDFSNASRSNPMMHQEGDQAGSGTTIIGNAPIVFSGTHPFFMRTNAGSREYTPNGFRQAEMPHLGLPFASQGEFDSHVADSDAHHAQVHDNADHSTNYTPQSTHDSHAGTSDAHHSRYTDSEAETAINNDADHGSTAQHDYFSGSHTDLTNVGASDHHSKTTSGEIDHDSTSGGTRSDAHHARYADSEAQNAVTGNVNVEDLVTAAVTAGYVPRAQGDNTILMQALSHSDLSGVGSDDHHAQNHDNADHTTNYLPESQYTPENDTHARYTNEEAQDAVGGILSVQFTYDDAGNVINIDPHVATSDAHHARYTDSEATTAVGGSTPWANSDLSNSTVTVAGNAVGLGGSTTVNHADLSNIGASDHHSRYADSEARNAVTGNVNVEALVTASTATGHVVRTQGDGTIMMQQLSHGDLGNVGTDDHHAQVHDNTDHSTDYLPQTSYNPEADTHDKYTDAEAQSAINNDADHGSTAPHNYFSGSHTDLTNVGASDHHTRYADSEAVTAAESQNPLSPESLFSQSGLSIAGWEVIDVSNEGFPGDQTGGDLANYIYNQISAGGKYVFILPEGTYDWNQRIHMNGGTEAWQTDRPHTFVMIGKQKATLNVDFTANGLIFRFGNNNLGLEHVSLQNLHFDIGAGVSARDAGIMQCYIEDSGYFDNITLSQRKKIADDGTSNGPRHTFLIDCLNETATALCERIKFRNGDVWNATYPGANYAIPISSEHHHEGRVTWRNCYVEGFHDNGYYLRDGPGPHHVENCASIDNGVSGFRLGRNDHAENITVKVSEGGVQRSCTGIWLQEYRQSVTDQTNYSPGDEPDSPTVVDGFEVIINDNAAADSCIKTSTNTTNTVVKNGYVYCGNDDWVISTPHHTGRATFQNITIDDHATGNTRIAAMTFGGDNVTVDNMEYRPFPPTGENGRSILLIGGQNIKIRDSRFQGTYTPMIEAESGADFTMDNCYCPHDGSFTDPYVLRAQSTPLEYVQLRNNRMGDYTGGINIDLADINNHYIKGNDGILQDAPRDVYTEADSGYKVEKEGTNAAGTINFDPIAGEVTIDGEVVATGPGQITTEDIETFEGGSFDQAWENTDLTIAQTQVYEGSYAAYATSGGGNQRNFDYENAGNNLSHYPRIGDKVRTFFWHPEPSSNLTNTTRIRWAYGGSWGSNYVIQCNLYNQNIRIWESGLTNVVAGPGSWTYPGATWFALESEWSSSSPHHVARVVDYSNPDNPSTVVEISGDSTAIDDTSSGAYWGAHESGGHGDFWVDYAHYYDI